MRDEVFSRVPQIPRYSNPSSLRLDDIAARASGKFGHGFHGLVHVPGPTSGLKQYPTHSLVCRSTETPPLEITAPESSSADHQHSRSGKFPQRPYVMIDRGTVIKRCDALRKLQTVEPKISLLRRFLVSGMLNIFFHVLGAGASRIIYQ